ncbi:MAG: glycosyltransferase [Candidatus Bathyarchaeota archaeon]|nr:glycosyltransferase [Candidatus Termiticorpusculum sp.]MCL1971267.1 glycosyltransferase [Candidatus Termiticorpusculum sp.]
MSDILPKVSIIVSTMNNEATIEECLQALLSQNYPIDNLEIILVDGGSKDKTVELAKKYPVKIYQTVLNCPAAYNFAQKLALYPILGFVDSDAKVEPDWLRKLVPHIADSSVGGVSGSIDTWNTDNPWARSIGYELKTRYRRIGKYTKRIATMNLLLKKAVLEEVGGWAEDMPSQYDTEFGYRLVLKGYKIAYEPSSVCYHFNRSSTQKFYRQQLQYGKNTLRLYLKHGTLAQGDEITDVGMNIQPIWLLVTMTSFLLGIIPPLRLLWYLSGILFLAMTAYYIYSATKIAIEFKDKSAMRLIILYYIRSFAWFTGAIITTIAYIGGKRRYGK